MSIRLALPKGRLLGETADLLQRAGCGLSGYREGARYYHFQSPNMPGLKARLFHEKDIPIQVAIGNYDLGICGLDWLEELLIKYPGSALVKVKNLGYGEGSLYVATSGAKTAPAIEELQVRTDTIRIASEYPNLAESFAVNLRLRRFSVFPLWGAAEAYPPDTADLALIPAKAETELLDYTLVPVSNILHFSAFLIANRNSWETNNMCDILASLEDKLPKAQQPSASAEITSVAKTADKYHYEKATEDMIRIALPDGHQQLPTVNLLNKAGIQVDDYPSEVKNRRPTTNLAGVMIKVIRPQDMPLQVANENFDLAITGKDWLKEHQYQFPSSPVTELVNLKLGKVKIVAVVSKDLCVESIHALRQLYAKRMVSIRVASEYINIADKYARDNHLGVYKVIPTWGASEAFLPGDADLLIENTETGRTITRHNLKIIDTLFESTACLIGNTNLRNSGKGAKIKSITETIRAAMEGA